MIQRLHMMDKEIREQLKGGRGAIPITHIFKKNQFTGKCRFMGKMTINPGCSVGLHVHEDEEEIYYILKGKAFVEDNGIRQEVEAGDAIITGGGASHSIENLSNEIVEVLGIILLFDK